LLATVEEGMKVTHWFFRHDWTSPPTPQRREVGVIELHKSWLEKPECLPSKDM
jgi:hypothetical protein